jgi:tyrosine-protein phosphatase SIW14
MKRNIVITIICALFLITGCASSTVTSQFPRPDKWASPVSSEHLTNFYKLDDKVYRSAQPDNQAFLELEALGFRSVLNLRDWHSDNDEARDTSINLYRVDMDAGGITGDQVIEALRIIEEAKSPILIHCLHGSDRTGLISAMYRIVFQGWSKEAAIDELMNGGYGYHSIYTNIPEFIKKADLTAIGRQRP